MQLSFSDVVPGADAHLDEHRQQPAAELLRAVAGALAGEHPVSLSVELQPHSLLWGLLLFFQLRSELCRASSHRQDSCHPLPGGDQLSSPVILTQKEQERSILETSPSQSQPGASISAQREKAADGAHSPTLFCPQDIRMLWREQRSHCTGTATCTEPSHSLWGQTGLPSLEGCTRQWSQQGGEGDSGESSGEWWQGRFQEGRDGFQVLP